MADSEGCERAYREAVARCAEELGMTPEEFEQRLEEERKVTNEERRMLVDTIKATYPEEYARSQKEKAHQWKEDCARENRLMFWFLGALFLVEVALILFFFSRGG